jgi:hypothetical protein
MILLFVLATLHSEELLIAQRNAEEGRSRG